MKRIHKVKPSVVILLTFTLGDVVGRRVRVREDPGDHTRLAVLAVRPTVRTQLAVTC